MNNNLLISFPDQSQSFTYGVEFGRILNKIELGLDNISNNDFPIRKENKQLLIDTCKVYGYIPIFGLEYDGGWIDFMGIKKTTSEN